MKRAAQSGAASATEQVWAAEEAYWRYLKEHDLKRYLALWSENGKRR
jgi:hypothetical protein